MVLHPGGPGIDNTTAGSPATVGRQCRLAEEFRGWGYQHVRKVNENGAITEADVV